MFITLSSIGTIALQVFLLSIIVASIFKTRLSFIARYSHTILRVIFIGAIAGSLIFEYYFGFEPCLLCWYQRIAIFGIGILLFTGDIRKSALLRKQILIFALAGFLVSLFHNYIDIFPSGMDVCGATGPSCLVRYIYEFGYITIPMMSGTVLLSAIIIPLISRCYPQEDIASV